MSTGTYSNTVINLTGSCPGIIEGVDAAKPSSAATGTIYIATDTQIAYRWTGSAWAVILSNGGGGGTPTLNQVLASGNVGGAGQEINLSDTFHVISTIWRGVTEAQGPIPAGLNASLVMGDQTTGFNCVIAASEGLTDYRLQQLPDKAGTFAMLSDIPTNLGASGSHSGTVSIGDTTIVINHGLGYIPSYCNVVSNNSAALATLLAAGYTIQIGIAGSFSVTFNAASASAFSYNLLWIAK